MNNDEGILRSQQEGWQEHWNDIYRWQDTAHMVSDFAREVAPFLTAEAAGDHESPGDRKGSSPDTINRSLLSGGPAEGDLARSGVRVVELGCGEGTDAAYFAQQGLNVEGLDFSETALARGRQRYGYLAGLTLRVGDISQSLPYASGSLDGVYARLTLHYFTDKVTKAIFGEIWRVLKTGGLLAFMCKTTRDHHYGQGQEVEQDMFVFQDGHVRHFFSEEYARACLGSDFSIERLVSWEVLKDGNQVGFVKV
ncbi:MAG TPA: class I SAM-dependent methyltransferase, partial [Ktedonosporobacter sp.]|nr:class I SAM-dependent methyltransferase [Ktedonosporobacter sp.]